MLEPAVFIEDDERTAVEKLEKLQASYIATATSDRGSLDAQDFSRLRAEFLNNAQLKSRMPDMVRKYRDQSQFWPFIKHKFPSYAERRDYIWAEFRPVFEYLEAQDRSPGVQPITQALEAFDPEHVHAIWQKALDRRMDDPEGAITAARTLLETVCKYVLDANNERYPDDADLPKLWALTSEKLNLAPHQHQEQLFKTILGTASLWSTALGLSETRSAMRMGTDRDR